MLKKVGHSVWNVGTKVAEFAKQTKYNGLC